MKKALIIGSGLTGTFIAHEFANKELEVLVMDINPIHDYFYRYCSRENTKLIQVDVLDKNSLENHFALFKPDLVVIAFGFSADQTRAQPERTKNTQLKGTENILNCSKAVGVKKLIYISSLSVYGDTKHLSDLTEDSPTNPSSLYGKIKLEVENYLLAYKTNISITVLRSSGVFGPILLDKGSRSSKIIEHFLVCSLNQIPIKIDVNKNYCDDFIYVKDLSSAVSRIALSKAEPIYNIFNVAQGQLTNFDDILNAFTKLFPNLKIEINRISTNSTINRLPLNPERIKKCFGFKCNYNLYEAIEDYSRISNLKVLC